MLRLAQAQDEIAVVADQRGCPTAAGDVAVAIRAIVGRLREGSGAFGVFHLAGAEDATWFDFANGIFDLRTARGAKSPRVVAISSDQYPTAARRPRDSRLDCSNIAAAYGLALPSWRRSLEFVLDQLLTGLETKV